MDFDSDIDKELNDLGQKTINNYKAKMIQRQAISGK